MLKISICSGGTGGHMFPAIALMEELIAKGHNVYIVTDTRGNAFCNNVKNKVVLKTIRFSRKKFWSGIVSFCQVFLRVLKLWNNETPNIIIGFGGLFTFIPAFLGKIFGAKLIIYEQNSVLGKANKVLSYISDLKLSTLMEANEKWKVVSSPVRREFLNLKNIQCTYDGDNLRIMIIGGSQGAASFSHMIPEALSMLTDEEKKKLYIVQQVGDNNFANLQDWYQKIGIKAKLITFIHNIAEEMTLSNLIICRSGASTLAELSEIARPAILIPYPNASDNHQFFNALCYKNIMGAWLVEESKDAKFYLKSIIRDILNDKNLLQQKIENIKRKNKSDFYSVFDEYIKQIEK